MQSIVPPRARRAALLALGAALSMLATLGGMDGASAAATSTASAAKTLVISGAGDGHGVGMSQDGAYGYAQHGWSDQQILAHYYTGTALGQAPANAVVKVLVGSKVQAIPLERYVRGVVSAEMPAEWPLAALEAQAIASRTYALTADAGGSRFDVYADTRSQVYLGKAAETARTNSAISATAGQIVTYAGKPAITYFYASSGGMTESVQNGFPGAEPEPWLQGVQDAYETSRSSWKVSLGFATAAARLKGLVKGGFQGIEVLARGYSPRILSAAVLGSGGSTTVSGPELEARLGLQSTWAYFGVRTGAGAVAPEPDRSGWKAPPTQGAAPTPPATATAPTVAPTTPTGVQGGSQAPGGGASMKDGGVTAG
ncbi:MAG TPA: SpoIID/LytB domain-containing protein [Solirubrobacteraceae bacterium]|nr:SpoIID/LytB domain-containing protein [Solirubrobacteraceae bacterium]